MISRRIGNTEILVDEEQPNVCYFKKDVVAKYKTEDLKSIDGICNIIYKVNNCFYFPLYVTIELTNYCNFNCVMCYINEEQKCLWEKNNIFKLVDELIKNGMLICKLTGGEILTVGYFDELYTYLRSKGVIVELYTNGLLLEDKHIELFKKYPPYKIEISIYGIDPKIFKNITGADPHCCNQVLNNILKLKKNRMNVIAKSVLYTEIYPDFENIRLWCRKNHIDFYYSVEVYNSYSGREKNIYNLTENIKFKYLSSLIGIREKKFGRKRVFECGAGKYGMYIAYDQKVYPCMKFVGSKEFGFRINLTKFELTSEQLQMKIEEYKGKYLQGCRGCNNYDLCKKCIATETNESYHINCEYYQRFDNYINQLTENEKNIKK